MPRTSKSAHAGVVDEDVDSAQGLIHVRCDGSDGAQFSDVARECFGPPTGFRDGSSGGFQRLAGPSAKHDYSSQTGDCRRNRGADAASRARDHGDLAGQTRLICRFHWDLWAMIVMLGLRNYPGARHILQDWRETLESKLALVEVH